MTEIKSGGTSSTFKWSPSLNPKPFCARNDTQHLARSGALGATTSTFQTDEIICTHVYNWLTCAGLETEATCTANTECVWDDNDGCDFNAIDKAVVQNDFNAGVNGLMSSTPGAACGAITVEATCTADTTCV